jgi:hypothetical protein
VDDLIAFLRARLDEDEMAARAAAEAAQTSVWMDGAEGSVLGVGGDMHLRGAVRSIDDIGPHIARWDPARVLAEVEAKRRIVDWSESVEAKFAEAGLGEHANGTHMVFARWLAEPYAEHPDYRPEWQSQE